MKIQWVWLPALKGDKMHRTIEGYDTSWCGSRVDCSSSGTQEKPAGACARCSKSAQKEVA